VYVSEYQLANINTVSVSRMQIYNTYSTNPRNLRISHNNLETTEEIKAYTDANLYEQDTWGLGVVFRDNLEIALAATTWKLIQKRSIDITFQTVSLWTLPPDQSYNNTRCCIRRIGSYTCIVLSYKCCCCRLVITN